MKLRQMTSITKPGIQRIKGLTAKTFQKRPGTKLGAFIAVAVIAGVGHEIHMRDLALTEMPERIAQEASYLRANESFLRANVELDLAAISKALDEELAKSFAMKGRQLVYRENGFFGKLLNRGRQWKVHANYDGAAVRGPISITSVGGVVTLRTYLKLDAKVGLSGDVAKLVRLHKKNIDGDVDIVVRVSFDGLNADGTLKLKFDPDVKVNKARVELAHRANLDLEGLAQTFADGTVTALKIGLAQQLRAEVLEENVLADVWHQSVTEIGSPEAPVYAVFSPESVGLSGLIADHNKAQITAAVFGRIEMTPNKPNQTDWVATPEIISMDEGKTGFHVSMPMQVPFTTINAAIAETVPGEIIVGDTTFGLSNVELYPSGDRLALIADIKGDLPGYWGDFNGRVALMGRPELTETEEGQVIQLVDVGFAREIDNRAWRAISAAGRDLIVEHIEEGAVLNLTELSEDARLRANSIISAEGLAGGTEGELTTFSVLVSRFEPTIEGLQLVVDASATLNAQSDFGVLK